ncbi:peptidase domain-containing ABC transporter (plasmid) [Brevundimonas staleyi]|uniref:Peptidase domain-containing ABC transporter n=1 Tax=Brevundimonas staleyi TaxID=74326 RepID=A0ABW0FPT0_9CAUL
MSALDDLRLTGGRRLPMFRASEAAECGLACAAMVAAYHKRPVDLNSARQRYPASMAGMTLKGLMRLAEHLGLSSRALRVELSALRKVPLPAVLHWDMNHFVVLAAWKGDKAVIHDPAVGQRQVAPDELSERFTGVVLELRPQDGFALEDGRNRITLTSFWTRIQGLWGALAQVAVLSVCLQLLTIALPLQLQFTIDQAIPAGSTSLLGVIALAFAGLYLIHAVVQALRDWVVQIISGLLSYQLIGNVVGHMMRLPIPFFENRHVGDILSRLTSTNAIRDVLARSVVSSLIDGVTAIAIIVVIFAYSPLLAAVAAAGIAVNAGVSTIAYLLIRARTEEQLVEGAKEQSVLMENVRAAAVIRVHGEEAQRENRWREAFAAATNATISLGRYQVGLRLAQNLLNGAQAVLIVYLGGGLVVAGDGFSVGMLVAFLSFRQILADRVALLIENYMQFRLLGLHLERLSDIVSTPAETGAFIGEREKIEGRIEIENVTFAYGAGDRPVLSDFSLMIEPGSFVALTGPSGQGKTTLFKLMIGALEPTAGHIRLDGQIADPGLWREWRRHIGVVSQDDRLLAGSLADNIAFFDPQLDMNRVFEAARAANIHLEIEQMPMQYHTLVGDMGAALSGGQKQRVLLARALYRRPSVLLLDEGTANLDPRSEERIADTLKAMTITRVVVAHRPVLLESADRVVRIHGGRLIA